MCERNMLEFNLCLKQGNKSLSCFSIYLGFIFSSIGSSKYTTKVRVVFMLYSLDSILYYVTNFRDEEKRLGKQIDDHNSARAPLESKCKYVSQLQPLCSCNIVLYIVKVTLCHTTLPNFIFVKIWITKTCKKKLL